MAVLAKPEPTKRVRARAKRIEQKVIAKVRAEVFERDPCCRLAFTESLVVFVGQCQGMDELAHLGEWRRYRTVHQPPEQRTHSRGTLKLCSRHHRAYDAHEFDLAYGEDGADGRLDVIPYVKVAM
jgi:hypothetical protein